MLLEEATLLSFYGGLQAGMGALPENWEHYSYDTDEEQTAQDAHSKD